MAALDFLSLNREITALHYNHNTPHSDQAEQVVKQYCENKQIDLLVGHLQEDPPVGDSKEEFWRKSRYDFFESVAKTPAYDLPIITCHHLDDVVETWIFTSMHGKPQLIPSRRGRFLRPFLGTRKAILEDWCDRKSVPYVVDPSNVDVKFMRNYIRHEIVPRVLRINPGIHKVLRKKIENDPVIFE